MGKRVHILRTSIQRSEGRWVTVYRHSGPLCKGKMGGGRHGNDTQVLYLKVRREVGEIVQALRTPI